MEESSKPIDRRRALQLIGGLALGGLAFVAACKKNSDEDAAPASTSKPAAGGGTGASGGGQSCQNAAPIDDASKQMRRTLAYVEKSNRAGANCAGCSQFIAGQYGACGGCKLFTGAVNPQGVCLSYAPLNAPAPSPAAKGG